MSLHAKEKMCSRPRMIDLRLNTIGMNTLQLKGVWNEVKGKLKQKYATLTDDDVTLVEGKEEELFGRLQQRLGKTKEEIMKEIASI